jgi:hypothetical protein
VRVQACSCRTRARLFYPSITSLANGGTKWIRNGNCCARENRAEQSVWLGMLKRSIHAH